ncbi:MAG: DUF3078 domain-containing protein [Bacteroidia bacterium]|nr:DUF3078 domain-containing protein [Bacteroidia bacterium]
MKHLLTLLIIIGFIANVFSQNDALQLKKQELENAKSSLTEAQKRVKTIEQEIIQLTPPVYWQKGGFGALNFNSLGLTNWAAGGVSANSVTAIGNIYRNYKKGKVEWRNNLDLAYGLIKNKGETLRKNEDKIDFLTKGNYGITDKLSYSSLLNFKSQFAPGFDFSDPTKDDKDREEISKFLAPAYLTTSIGLNYNFTDYFSVYVSPATGKFTFVNDDSIAAKNIYIPATLDNNGVQFYNDRYRAEFGALFNAQFKKDLTKKISLTSTLNLFNNFTDVNTANRENIDVNWETMINMKLTEYIGVSFYTNLIHDNDVAVPLYEDNKIVGSGPRTQFKRLLGIGFSYKF